MSAVSPARPAGVVTMALHAEWTKIRTLPGMSWLPVTAAALTMGAGAAAAAAFHCADSACSSATTGADPAKISLTGLDLGQVFVAVLAVLVVGGEYGTGMIRVTLTAMPHRLVVLLAKAVVVTGLTLAASLVGVLGSMLAGRLLLPPRGMTATNGYRLLSLGNGADLRAMFGSMLYLVLIALFALGITVAVRDSGVAIGIVLGLLFVFPIVTAVIPDHTLARHLEQASPMIAGQYIEATTMDANSLPLTPWQGLCVLAAMDVRRPAPRRPVPAPPRRLTATPSTLTGRGTTGRRRQDRAAHLMGAGVARSGA
jgi:ABC-2 type transport system permease protein